MSLENFNKINFDLQKVITFAENKNIIYDWIIFSNKNLFVNLNIANNTIKKWYNNDVLSINQSIYCFKQHNIDKINLFNYETLQKIKQYNNLAVINYCDFLNCNSDNINDFFIVIVS